MLNVQCGNPRVPLPTTFKTYFVKIRSPDLEIITNLNDQNSNFHNLALKFLNFRSSNFEFV